VPLSHHALLLIRLRRLDDALPLLDRLRKFEPLNPYFSHGILTYYYAAHADFARAHEELDLVERATQGVSWDDRVTLFAMAGDRDKAVGLLAEKEREPGAATHPAELAWCHGVLGDLDQCFHWMEKAIEAHEFWPRVWRNSPEVEAVRRDPRFAQMLRRVNLDG
jgi:tetratricopeptide (TPR) repeat protein